MGHLSAMRVVKLVKAKYIWLINQCKEDLTITVKTSINFSFIIIHIEAKIKTNYVLHHVYIIIQAVLVLCFLLILKLIIAIGCGLNSKNKER